MIDMRWVRYGIGFLAELIAVVGCAATAFLFLSGVQAWSLGGVIAGAIVVAWGVLLALKATVPLPMVAYYVVKGLLYLWAAV
ncbi:MAG: hypothetical protein DI570_25430, partial [Phenylobacterium zucineum]